MPRSSVNALRYWQALRQTFLREGLLPALRQVIASLRWRLDPRLAPVRAALRDNAAFDRQHGTDTGGEIPLEHLGLGSEDARQGNGVYRGISALHFHAALAGVHVRFEDFTFLDYGSGKGKALLLAMDYPFRRIIGVEFSAPLHEAALDNLRRYGNARRRVEAVLADARWYTPPAEPLLCFFFNPFAPEVWRAVLARLQDSVRQAPRAVYLVYVNIRNVSELEGVFPEFPLFETVAQTRNFRILRAAAPDQRRG